MWTSEMHCQAAAGIPPIQNRQPAADAKLRRRVRARFRCRRSGKLLLAVAVLIFAFATPCAASAQDSHYHVIEVKPNVFVWVAEDILNQEGDPQFKRAGNAGFVVTSEGVVVINTTNSPFNARAVLYEIRKRTQQPVRYVINTGASPDLMLGNEAFEDFEPTFLSTPQAAQAMRTYHDDFPARIESDWRLAASMRGVHPLPPNETFDKETTLKLGGTEIRLINLGDNASPGDAAVYLPQSKVLFLGNVFENQYIPHIGTANIDEWIATLRKVEGWDAEVYVPAHGEPGGKASVEEFRRFLEWLSGQVQAGIDKGKSLSQVQDELVPFKNFQWHAPELESDAVAAVYRLRARARSQNSSSSARTTSP
jgi:glyoxylase-like metal-dependent hydrolase (beta-lactamase superfamily II)